ncbi:leucine-rich repeat-containing protein 74B-like [Pollicipes pollicipes]|uniref:leucine-rich repeat-containing protein 74B-like n=1 Tax=Pollicipes pollicipes TaxID=41117 RepID=UPI0018849259|nr:leucine-rich repeat-containing protein 74B-like [Pollicipes pollicipes]
MFRSVERPELPRERPGSQSSGEYESSEEEKPYNMKPSYSDPLLDILSLRLFCQTDAESGRTSIRLCGNELSQPRRGCYFDREAAALAGQLASRHDITDVDFSYNRISDGGRHLAWLLSQPQCALQELDLGQTGQTVASLTALLTALRTNSSLLQLRLSVRKFGLTDDQMRLVCDGLAGNGALTHLDLTANRLHRDAARHLVSALAENSSLRVLRLCHNHVQTEGAIWLAQGLAEHGAREEVHVRSNDIGSDGLLALLNELKYARVRLLHFWGNPWCLRVPAEVDVLWKTGVVDETRVDVRPYVVDYVPHLAELRQTERQRYYNVTKYADRTNDKVRIGFPV